jgi:hypothetical protein
MPKVIFGYRFMCELLSEKSVGRQQLCDELELKESESKE